MMFRLSVILSYFVVPVIVLVCRSIVAETVLSYDSLIKTTIDGTSLGTNIGFSVSGVGDVNNDSFPDLLFSSFAHSGDRNIAILLYGSQSLGDTVSQVTNTSGIFLTSYGEGIAQSPMQVSAAGDFNKDGFADFLLCTTDPDTEIRFTLLVYGKPQSPSPLLVESLGATGFVQIFGRKNDYRLSVAPAGDVNNDGFPDIIIGQVTRDIGCASVIYGGVNVNAEIYLDTLSSNDGFRLCGDQNNVLTGIAVAGEGDVDNDGYDDLLIGEPRFSNSVGRVFLVKGRSNFHATMNLASDSDAEFSTISGPASCGASVSFVGDVNGDQLDDFLIGCPAFNSDAGLAILIFGSTSYSTLTDLRTISTTNSTTLGVSIRSNSDQEFFGFIVGTIGDLNQDGYYEFVISAPNYNAGQGRVFLFYGNKTFPSSISTDDLSGINVVIINGGTSLGSFGLSLGFPGDIDSDGYHDLLVGSPIPRIVTLVYGETFFITHTQEPTSVPSTSPSSKGTTPFLPVISPTVRPSSNRLRKIQITLFLELLFFDTRMVPPQRYSNIIVEVLRNFTGLPEAAIAVDYPPGSIRSLLSTFSLLVTPVLQAPPSLSVVYTARMRFNAIDYPHVEGNNSRLIMEVERNLSRAIDEGEVRELLKVFGGRDGYTNYTSLLTGDYSFTSLELSDGEGDNGDSSSKLSDGVITGIVIAVVVSVILFVLL